MTTTWNVTLSARLHGSTAFTTNDTIEAATAHEAERKLIEQWKAVEPAFEFVPLLTVKQ